MASNQDKSTFRIEADQPAKNWLPFFVIVCSVVSGLLLAYFFVKTMNEREPVSIDTAAVHTPVDAPIKNIPRKEPPSPATPELIVGQFSEIKACIVTNDEHIPLRMYLANTPQLRKKGLQEVAALPANTGMLFVYNQIRSAESQFWMHNTLMNLDIAYLDGHGTIRTIQQMPSCSSSAEDCPRYQAGVPFLAAAEFPQGFFRKNGVTVGDRLSTDFFSDCQ